jgi:hypothetical protein
LPSVPWISSTLQIKASKVSLHLRHSLEIGSSIELSYSTAGMAIRQKSIARVFFCLLALALVLHKSAGARAQSTGEGPRIDAVQIGLANCYKVGHWTPIRVDASGIASLKEARFEVTVIDSDGVETTSAAPIPTADAGANNSAVVYTKVGRVGAPVQVALVNGETPIARRVIRPDRDSNGETSLVELPPTAELIVALGLDRIGLRQAFADRGETAGESARRVVEIKSITELPTEWFGYDAVDVLVVSASETNLCRQLAADTKRFAALLHWIELGGRLVFLCPVEAPTGRS